MQKPGEPRSTFRLILKVAMDFLDHGRRGKVRFLDRDVELWLKGER